VPPRRSSMDYESMATTMDSDPLQESQIAKARRTVAAQSARFFPDDKDKAVDYATHVMKMLGIHPSQDDDHVPSLAPNMLANSIND